jgi:hypothetical protein
MKAHRSSLVLGMFSFCFDCNLSGGITYIIVLVLEILPYDFLLNAARLHKCQKCSVAPNVEGFTQPG